MHLIGRGNRGRETYPRAPQGFGAVSPYAQLGLSEVVPFVDGVNTIVPFDTVIYQSAAFGGFEDITGNSTFFVPFGVYLVTLQLDVDTTPTMVEVGTSIISASNGDAAASTSASSLGAVALSLSAVRFGSETPIPGHVLPCAIPVAVLVTGGGDGNVALITKMFVWKLQEFQASP